MYEFLEGELVSKSPDHVVLEIQGIGYTLHVPFSTYEQLPEGRRVRLLTHFHTSEDSQKLFGFLTREERVLFRLLINVSGVGPATALTLLSQLSPIDFANALAHEDLDSLKRVKGIGEKTAKRILLELKEKLPKLGLHTEKISELKPFVRDAVAALVSIGYDRTDAETAIRAAQKKVKSQNFEDLVKAAISGR